MFSIALALNTVDRICLLLGQLATKMVRLHRRDSSTKQEIVGHSKYWRNAPTIMLHNQTISTGKTCVHSPFGTSVVCRKRKVRHVVKPKSTDYKLSYSEIIGSCKSRHLLHLPSQHPSHSSIIHSPAWLSEFI